MPSKKDTTIAVAIIGAIGVLGAAYINSRAKGAPAPQVTASPAPAPTPTQAGGSRELTPIGIYRALDSTPPLRRQDAIKALYVGRELEWTGRVSDVWASHDTLGLALCHLTASMDYCSPILWAFFDKKWQAKLSTLRRNDTVRVNGVIAGVDMRIYVKSSSLVPR